MPCGLQYKVIKSAKSMAKSPKVDTPCEVHYKGRVFGSGAEFHCSYTKAAEPERHVPNKVIHAWTVALQLMGVGDKWLLFVPSELGYGDAGRGRDIPPHAALTFEIELVAVRSESAPPKVPRPAGMSNEELLQLASASASSAAAPDEGAVATGGSPVAPRNGLFDRTTPVLDGKASKARPSSKQPPRPPKSGSGGEEAAAENAALREQLAEAEKYIEAQAARIEQLTQENGQFRATLEKAIERAVQWSEVAQRNEAALEEALEREARMGGGQGGADGPERRLDTDGAAYTYEEFLEEYGGDAEWNAAKPALND